MVISNSNDGSGHRIIFSRPLPRTAITKEINVNGKLLQRFAGGLAGITAAEAITAAAAIAAVNAIPSPADSAITVDKSFEILIRYRNRTYPVTCRSRRTGTYDKWVLACGWLNLVRANNLQTGDIVTLFKPMEIINQRGGNYDNLFVMEDVSAGELGAAEALLQLSNTVPP